MINKKLKQYERSISIGKKPTLRQLSLAYNRGNKNPISSSDLAKAANVPLSHSYAVEVGGFTQREIAYKVLQAFSHLVGFHFNLSDIQVYTEQAY
jgi:hypothetical protein